MFVITRDQWIRAQQGFDFVQCDAVLSAFGFVAVVPVKFHDNVCTNVCAVKGAGSSWGKLVNEG